MIIHRDGLSPIDLTPDVLHWKDKHAAVRSRRRTSFPLAFLSEKERRNVFIEAQPNSSKTIEYSSSSLSFTQKQKLIQVTLDFDWFRIRFSNVSHISTGFTRTRTSVRMNRCFSIKTHLGLNGGCEPYGLAT